jgi:hypothetical protein
MVGEGERGEGDVGFLSSGDAGCGNARQPGNQITDHSARCQPWLIFHSTRVAARLGPAERQGGGHLQRAAKHGPPHLSVFLPSARGRELSLGENHVKVKMVQTALEPGRLGRIFLTGSTASTSAMVSASAPGNGRTPAWIHVHVAERRDPLALCILGRGLGVQYRPGGEAGESCALRASRDDEAREPPTPQLDYIMKMWSLVTADTDWVAASQNGPSCVSIQGSPPIPAA